MHIISTNTKNVQRITFIISTNAYHP